MSNEHQLLLQAISSANTLNRTIRDNADSIDSIVEVSLNKLNVAKKRLIEELAFRENIINTVLPVSPNLMIDTAFFTLFSNMGINEWYDYLLPGEKVKFIRGLPVVLNGVDISKSSIKVKVIPGFSQANKPDDTGLFINGDLMHSSPNTKVYGYPKYTLVFDLSLFKMKGAANLFFGIKNPPNLELPFKGSSSKFINNELRFSGFFNIISTRVPMLTSNSASAKVVLADTGLNTGANIYNYDLQNGETITSTSFATGKNVVNSLTDINTILTWKHISKYFDSAVDMYLPSVNLTGTQWETESFNIKFAITLPYLGMGGCGAKPTWISEFSEYNTFNDSFGSGFHYPVKK